MRVYRIPVLTVFLILSLGFGLFAQSNDRIDELLLQEIARFDSTAYLVLSAGGLIPESDSPESAFQKALELGLAKPDRTPESPVRADELSYMLMESLSIKGGVMYRIFPGKRYAYRELAFNKMMSETGGPGRKVAGDEVIRILGYAFALKGGEK